MDALILSCGTGGGHNAAARAIKEELERRGHRAHILNPYTLSSDKLANTINQAYIKLARSAPSMFGAVYKLGKAWKKVPLDSPVLKLNGKMVPILEKYLEEHPADILISTHIFPLEIITNMKKQGKKLPPDIMVATDYTCIPLMDEVDSNAYVIPNKDLIKDFTDYDIPADKIYPLGIPVQKSFSEDISQSEAREKLGLSMEKQYVLLAGGSFGAGKIKKAIELLTDYYRSAEKETQLIVICGNNDRLYEYLKEKYGNEVLPVSFTDQMPLYVKACDVFITKPGGLTSTEAAVAGVPLVMFSPIPGCESCNLKFYDERGMSKPVLDPEKDLISVLDGLSTQEARDAMMQNQKEYISPRAAQDVCLLAEKLTKGPCPLDPYKEISSP